MINIPDPPAGTYFLYADDDQDDQDFFRSMISEIDTSLGAIVVENGLELLQFLNHIPQNGNLPSCIVLDINMPVWDGIRALKALKVEERFKNIPVIMFTTSRSLRDNDLCLKLGAQAFITKPVNHNQFSELYAKFADAYKKD